MTRTCSDCPAEISKYSKGRCRPCALLHTRTDPALVAKRLSRLRETVSSKEHREKLRLASIKREAEKADDPAWRAMRLAGGRRILQAYLASPEAQRKRAENYANSPARDVLAWCPVDRRAEYQRVRRELGATEARRILEEDIGRQAVEAQKRKLRLAHERRLMEAY